MKVLLKKLIVLCCGSTLLASLETTAFAHESHGPKKKRSRTHKHSHDDHGHSHGGHNHSPFSLGLGMSVSKALKEEVHAEGEEGHTHLMEGLGLHGGHGGGTPGEAGGEPDGQPYFSATAGYELSERWQLNLTQGFSSNTGIADTAFGITFSLPMTKRLKLSTTAAATAPISQESKDSFKITTVMIGAGPTWKKGRWEISAKGYLAKSYYSKTVVIEEETATGTTPLRFQEEPPIDEHALEELGATGDREFDRYGAESEIAYRMAKRWQFGIGGGGAMATKQWGATMYEVEATLAQLTYSWKSLSTSLGFMMTSEAEKFQAPDTPTVAFNIMYIFE